MGKNNKNRSTKKLKIGQPAEKMVINLPFDRGQKVKIKHAYVGVYVYLQEIQKHKNKTRNAAYKKCKITRSKNDFLLFL